MKADLDLVKEAKMGNQTAFSELVARHQRRMMRVALRLTRDWDSAEDVVQDSFIKAYQNLPGFEERASFRSWLYQITINTAKNRLRSHSRESVGIDQLVIATDEKTEGRLAEVDVRKVIRDEIALLPTRQQRALTLRIFEDLSFKEIAEIMKCPYDTAKANYRHALLKLRSRLEGNVGLQNFTGSETISWIEYSRYPAEAET